MKEIVFKYIGKFSEIYPPAPAKKVLPTWYKRLPDYENNKKGITEKGQTNATGKKCMPMFDAMTFGYIIFTYVDIFVEELEDGSLHFSWPSQEALNFHASGQMETWKGIPNNTNIPKFMNHYLIKTPKGYSTYFCPPINHENIIIPFSGVVDTDTYIETVNFPFTIAKGFTGTIPAGTPLVQVIPFKREEWKMTKDDQNIIKEAQEVHTRLFTAFFNKYKNMFWHRKTFN